MNWSEKLDRFGIELLEELGVDPDWLPRDHNPIAKALETEVILLPALVIWTGLVRWP